MQTTVHMDLELVQLWEYSDQIEIYLNFTFFDIEKLSVRLSDLLFD